MPNAEMTVTGVIDRALSGALVLPLTHHAPPARPLRPVSDLPVVRLTDPAVRVMTDFKQECPMTVAEDRSIDDALNDMILFGVRALLVVRGEVVSGLITSYDIQGERPLQFLQSTTYTRHDELQVGHIMTPWEDVPALDWETIANAHVSRILQIFQGSWLTHLVVVEAAQDRSVFVRGLISRTRLERQLGAQPGAAGMPEQQGMPGSRTCCAGS